jgi:hypothetical protein
MTDALDEAHLAKSLSPEQATELRDLLRTLLGTTAQERLAHGSDITANELLAQLDERANTPLACDGCGAQMRPVGGCPPYQVDDGLSVRIQGGYGMFFDAMKGGDPTLSLCHDCSVRLITTLSPAVQERFIGQHGFSGCCIFAKPEDQAAFESRLGWAH